MRTRAISGERQALVAASLDRLGIEVDHLTPGGGVQTLLKLLANPLFGQCTAMLGIDQKIHSLSLVVLDLNGLARLIRQGSSHFWGDLRSHSINYTMHTVGNSS